MIYKDKYNLSVRRANRCIQLLESENIISARNGGRIYTSYTGTDKRIIDRIKSIDPLYRIIDDTYMYCSRSWMTQITMKPIMEWNWVKSLSGWDLIHFIITIHNFPKNESKTNSTSEYKRKYLDLYNNVFCQDKCKDENGFPITDKRMIKSNRVKKLITRSNELEEQLVDTINATILSTELIPDDVKWFFIYSRQFGKDTTQNGRFYSNFNRVKKEYRDQILKTLDYTEIDMKNTNLNILWKLATGKYYWEITDSDFYSDLVRHTYVNYNLTDADIKVLRPIYKQLMLSMLGSNSISSCSRALRKMLIDFGCHEEKNPKKIKNRKTKEERWRTFLEERHLPLNSKYKILKFEYIESGLITFCEPIQDYLWNDATVLCMNLESRMIEKVMFESIKDGYLPLSIHDCICVPRKEQVLDKYNNLMITYLDEAIKRRREIMKHGIVPIE